MADAVLSAKAGQKTQDGFYMLNKLGHPDALWLEGGTNDWLTQNN